MRRLIFSALLFVPVVAHAQSASSQQTQAQIDAATAMVSRIVVGLGNEVARLANENQQLQAQIVAMKKETEAAKTPAPSK